MRKSVFGVLAVAALAASSIAIDSALLGTTAQAVAGAAALLRLVVVEGPVCRSATAVALGPSAVARRGGAPFRQVFKPIAV